MIIVGGIYEETCRFPHWQQMYGSGLRAAIAVSQISPSSTLYSYAPSECVADIEASLNAFEINAELTHVTSRMPVFNYLHPFENFWVAVEKTMPPIEISGDVILRFGMVEGDAVVSGKRVVYDPQSDLAGFSSNNSYADELILILKKDELFTFAWPNTDENERKKKSLKDTLARIHANRGNIGKLYIVLKDKFGSLTIVDIDGKITPIQSYGVEQYFRIGAGDILAASLAYAWGEKRKSLPEAADYASRALAYFVDGARLPLPLSEFTTGAVVSKPVNRKIRVVGAGSDTLQRHLMLFHAHEWIAHLGGHLDAAQLPLETIDDHILEVDDDCLYFVIISEDINAFNIPRQFEKVKHLPTVVFCPKDYVKFVTPWFINARITDDFATALYHAFRTA